MGTEWSLLVCTQNCFEQAMIRCEKYNSLVRKHGILGNQVRIFFFSTSSATRVPVGLRVSAEDANMLLGFND